MPLATNNRRYSEFSTAMDPRILRVKQAAGQLNGAAVDMNPAGAAQQRNAAGTAAMAGMAGAAGTGTGTSSTTKTTVSGQSSSSSTYGGSSERPSQWTQNAQAPAPFSYNAEKPQAFNYSGEKPGQYQAPEAMSPYKSQYTQQLSDLLNKITGRGEFSYDLNSDMLYQNAKDQYMLTGQQAMMDTMGQAQAMTGGYGNSYAQQAGQQTYQQYLGRLNEMVPQLYDRAYQRWQDQGNQMLQEYGLYQNADAQDYARYQDALNQWNQNRSFDYGRYQDELGQFNADRSFAYNQHRDQMDQYNADRSFAYQMYGDQLDQFNQDRNFDYNRYLDQLSQWNADRNFERQTTTEDRSYYGKLVNTLLSEGKWPNAELLARAGYTEGDIASYLGPRPDPNATPAADQFYAPPGYEQQPYVEEPATPVAATTTRTGGNTRRGSDTKKPGTTTGGTGETPPTVAGAFSSYLLQKNNSTSSQNKKRGTQGGR